MFRVSAYYIRIRLVQDHQLSGKTGMELNSRIDVHVFLIEGAQVAGLSGNAFSTRTTEHSFHAFSESLQNHVFTHFTSLKTGLPRILSLTIYCGVYVSKSNLYQNCESGPENVSQIGLDYC